MAEESSFEIVKKSSELEADSNAKDNTEKDIKTASLISASVPPPSALPTFVTSSGNDTMSSSNAFHSKPFRPEIPENQNNELGSSVEDESLLDYQSLGMVGSSMFGWVKDTIGNRGTSILTKVAEKAKSSVDSVITTLDPQMKELLSGGLNSDMIVASGKEVEISPVREAFQNVFGRKSVRGFDTEELPIAKQLVGFEAASKSASLKIDSIQKMPMKTECPIVAVENFLAEISPDNWYDLDLIVLYCPEKNLRLETYSQMIPVPKTIANVIKEDTPKDYQFIDTGYGVTVSQVMSTNLQVHPSEWQETLTGLPRRERILSAAQVIANLYKNALL